MGRSPIGPPLVPSEGVSLGQTQRRSRLRLTTPKNRYWRACSPRSGITGKDAEKPGYVLLFRPSPACREHPDLRASFEAAQRVAMILPSQIPRSSERNAVHSKAPQLFFPTVHIHDGQVHSKAHFDRQLYCQRLSEERLSCREESPRTPAEVLTAEELSRSLGIVVGHEHLYRLGISFRPPLPVNWRLSSAGGGLAICPV